MHDCDKISKKNQTKKKCRVYINVLMDRAVNFSTYTYSRDYCHYYCTIMRSAEK